MEMTWTEEAENAVARVPFFVGKRVRKHVEDEAVRRGAGVVLLEHVHSCRKRFLEGKDLEIKGFQIETCFGAGGCENRILRSEQLVNDVETLLAKRNIRDFLKDRVFGPLKMHHEFRVSVSDCPNACSRPQIVDIGIIGARRPSWNGESCTACGACREVCREKAIEFTPGIGITGLNPEKCVRCGKCLEVCPSETLTEDETGWRILVGGKLGRHPQLGKELEGIHTREEVLVMVERCLEVYFRCSEAGERFGSLLDRIGLESLM
jgi:dissimilatory sulfite reductase (desulfoviridin) alpha/beta subunit